MINTHIKSTNFNMSPSIEDYITSKVSGLEKFLHVTSDEVILAECEVAKSTHHKKGDVFTAEINLTVKGKLKRSVATSSDVRKAIDSAKDQLEAQILRSKSKRFELYEKGARVIKSILRKNNG